MTASRKPPAVAGIDLTAHAVAALEDVLAEKPGADARAAHDRGADALARNR